MFKCFKLYEALIANFFEVLNFCHFVFEFVSDFEIRISYFILNKTIDFN